MSSSSGSSPALGAGAPFPTALPAPLDNDDENCPRTAPHQPHYWDFDDEDGPVELYCPGQ